MRNYSTSGLIFITIMTLFLTIGFANAQQSKAKSPISLDILEAWQSSPHADQMSQAFTHWNDDKEIPGNCAVCHSTQGITDYLSGPMSTPGVIDHPVPVGQNIECSACHNDDTKNLTAIPFPSGSVIDSFDTSATCAICHQGRASVNSVNTAIANKDEDAIDVELNFINIHYAPAAASLMGSKVNAGYEYGGKSYTGQFEHVPNLNQCTECHNPHSLKVELENCTTCHQGIQSFDQIRTSMLDFDGNGDTADGIYNPIRNLHQRLAKAIMQYANDVIKTPVVYSEYSYPYFFVDTDANSKASKQEAIFPNRYQSWTPRLLKAAYNYQFIAKEKGIYVHNPHYALQLLYDSLNDLSQKIDLDMNGLVRPKV